MYRYIRSATVKDDDKIEINLSIILIPCTKEGLTEFHNSNIDISTLTCYAVSYKDEAAELYVFYDGNVGILNTDMDLFKPFKTKEEAFDFAICRSNDAIRTLNPIS